MKFLVVEDSQMQRQIVRNYFRDISDSVEIIETSNGLEAYEYLQDNKVDVIFCNWSMPLMSGMELLRLINEEKPYKRFGFFSAHQNVDITDDAKNAGADFFIEKPLLKHNLVSLIENGFINL